MRNLAYDFLLLDGSHRVEVLLLAVLGVILIACVIVLSIIKKIKAKKEK